MFHSPPKHINTLRHFTAAITAPVIVIAKTSNTTFSLNVPTETSKSSRCNFMKTYIYIFFSDNTYKYDCATNLLMSKYDFVK